MKNLILPLVCLALLFACRKESSSQKAQLEAKLEASFWEVTHYSSSSENLSSTYIGSKLEFTENGTIKIHSSADNYDGRWTVSDHSSDGQSDLHVNLTFESLNDFLRLTNNWELALETQYRIELIKGEEKLILTQIQ